MQTAFPTRAAGSRWLVLALSVAILAPPLSIAFPPAPHHVVYGTVRDQVGNPLFNGPEVIFEAASGAILRTPVSARTDGAYNYRFEIPMDAGLSADRYHPTALMPAAPFRMRVRVGRTLYLPIEMTGKTANIGQPAGRTRIDLTLGEDADGNGLPDAWEKAVAAQLGLRWQAGQIRPGDLYPGSGMTYLDVYVAGTYAVDPKDGFALQILAGSPRETPRLAFTAVKGRTYTVQSAAVLGEWGPASFALAPGEPVLQSYQATETRRLEISVPASADQPARFFRLMVE